MLTAAGITTVALAVTAVLVVARARRLARVLGDVRAELEPELHRLETGQRALARQTARPVE